MRIGIAGTGRMGSAVAARLIECGRDVVVWNRTPVRIQPLTAMGAVVAASPAALAAAVDMVITILTDEVAIAAVYDGGEGLLGGSGSEKIFVDMSTVRPATVVALAQRVREGGAAFLECPVGGTVGPARQGRLLGFVGGGDSDLARARPVLEQLCRRLDHIGPVGAAGSFKLAVNLPLAVYWQALGEAYALCRHLDVDRGLMIEVFQETSGATNALRARGDAVARALTGDISEPGAFDCDSMRKDLRTMIAEAAARGAELPVAESALAAYDRASADGWGQRDCTVMPAYWATRSAPR
jgi:3-hydroxyisobutyrate dehydrogenase